MITEQREAQGAPAIGSPTEAKEIESPLSLARLKKQFLDYLGMKTDEIEEQKDARRFYHGSQYTEEQIKAFRARKQPVVTYNREARKINGIVGTLEKQRREPIAFPRTPKQDQGAEIATATLKYAFQAQQWSLVAPMCGMAAAIDGIGGIELTIEQGDTKDPDDHDIGIGPVDPATFFYDPASLQADFSDARYMGVSKWTDVDDLTDLFPAKAEEIEDACADDGELTSNPDSDKHWQSGDGDRRRVRLVEHWYKHHGEWWFCYYTGQILITCGPSPFKDNKGKSVCKYIMFSAFVDQDGDRYGFHRNLKDAQMEVNTRRSRALHKLSSRRVIIQDGMGIDIDTVRKEAAKPDGVILYPMGAQPPVFDDMAKGAELQGELAFLTEAKNEIENYGVNPALMGQGVDKMSGVAQQMQQQAGMTELGPFFIQHRGWTLRVYRSVWSAIQAHWKAQRWIRVNDDPEQIQLFAINQAFDAQGNPLIDPMTGQPAIVNAIGALDVDIVVDEGPDTINVQQDVSETLRAIAQNGVPVPPEMVIEVSQLPHSKKKKLNEILEKKNQEGAQQQELALKVKLASEQAKIQDTSAAAGLKQAQTQKTLSEIGANGEQADPHEKVISFAEKAAGIRKTEAETAHTYAKANLDTANAQAVGHGMSIAAQDQHNEAAWLMLDAARLKHDIDHPKVAANPAE